MLLKVTILAAAVLAVGVANLGIAAAPLENVADASTVSVVPSRALHTDIELCDNNSQHQLCMAGFNDAVMGEPFNAGQQQDVDITQQSNCGGTVTNSPPCPFNSGSGFNNEFLGSTIIGITQESNGLHFLADSNDDILEASSGGGQVWVQVGNLFGVNVPAAFVNVARTNAQNTPEYACSDGMTGNTLILTGNGGEPNCNWIGVSGS